MTFGAWQGRAAAAVLVALLGYGAIVRPIEARIAVHADEITRETERFETQLGAARRLDALQHERDRLATRLLPLHLNDDRARILERFLQLGARTGTLHDTRISAIAADAPAAASGVRPEFDEVPLVMTLRGSYAGLLQTIRDFSTSAVPARLAIASIDATERRGGDARELVASVRIVLLRTPDGPPHARL